jgi:transcriptional regulator with XRE-family HTH domain
VEKTNDNSYRELGRIIKVQRIVAGTTLRELSARSGVSPSHLGRIERGQRLPSANILQRIAKPLGFEESELFTLAGYLSAQPLTAVEIIAEKDAGQLDPVAASILAQEPIEVQRTLVAILTVLKSIARSLSEVSM